MSSKNKTKGTKTAIVNETPKTTGIATPETPKVKKVKNKEKEAEKPTSPANKVQDTRDTKKVQKVNLDKATKDVVMGKEDKKDKKDKETTVSSKELKYSYPEDVKTASDKKTFRRNARAKQAQFEKSMQKLMDSKDPNAATEIDKIETERAAWAKKIYTAKA